MLDDLVERLPEQFDMEDIRGRVDEFTPYVMVAIQVCSLASFSPLVTWPSGFFLCAPDPVSLPVIVLHVWPCHTKGGKCCPTQLLPSLLHLHHQQTKASAWCNVAYPHMHIGYMHMVYCLEAHCMSTQSIHSICYWRNRSHTLYTVMA